MISRARQPRRSARSSARGGCALAGADWPEDFRLLEEAMRGRGYGEQIGVVNAAMGSLSEIKV